MRGSADYFVSGGITQTVYILLTVVCVCVYSAHCRFWRDWPYGPGPGSADGKKMVWGFVGLGFRVYIGTCVDNLCIPGTY